MTGIASADRPAGEGSAAAAAAEGSAAGKSTPAIEVWFDHAAPGLRERVEERLRAVVQPFASRVTRVALRVTDRNGARGGVDQACRVEAVVSRRGPVVVESVDTRRWPAVLRALSRLETALTRKLARERTRRERSRSARRRRAGAVTA